MHSVNGQKGSCPHTLQAILARSKEMYLYVYYIYIYDSTEAEEVEGIDTAMAGVVMIHHVITRCGGNRHCNGRRRDESVMLDFFSSGVASCLTWMCLLI